MKSKSSQLILPLAALSLASCAEKKEEPKRPNIIFMMTDDHTTQAMSCYGGNLIQTPNMDRIANEGLRFDNCYAVNALSGPSRACILTGKFSHENGFTDNASTFNGDQQTFPKLLQQAGYQTAMIGKWHLITEPQGFDFWSILSGQHEQGDYYDPDFLEMGKPAVEKGYATDIITDKAINFLEHRDKSKPFCMMLNFKAPHRSWEPDSCYMNLYDDVEFPYPETFNDDYSTRELTMDKSMAKISKHLSRGDLKMQAPEGLTQEEKDKWLWYGGSGENQFWTPDPNMSETELKKWKFQRYIKDYCRCVKSVDDQVGNVIAYLKKNNLFDNTIIIYMGDQGFYLGENGLYDKRWMYETSLQMPCLISYPAKIKAGTKIDDITLNIDMAPTLLDFAGLSIPEDMQGESFKGLLLDHDNAAKDWRKSMYYQYFEYPKWHRVQPHYGIRTERYKLIHFYYDIDVWEFYDLQKDPKELVNCYNNPEYKDIISELHTRLDEMVKKYDGLSLKERRSLTEKRMKKYEP